MKRLTVLRLFVALFVFAPLVAAEDNPAFPSLQPLFILNEMPVFGEDLLVSSLAFSLCEPHSESWNKCISTFSSLVETVRSESFLSMNEEERGEAVLNLLYEKVLRRYQTAQTKTDQALLEGTYNCVSASVLYAALATCANLRVIANETKDHAFCSLIVDGKKIDVETTNPGGFNPGTRKAIESSGGKTKYFIVPKKYYSGRKEISLQKLVTLPARNLSSAMNDSSDYAQAVPVSVSRLVYADFLNEFEKASVREDFDTICGNYAVELDHKKQYERALEWLNEVFNAWGSSSSLLKNYSNIAYNGFATAMNKNDYEGAGHILETFGHHISEKERQSYQNQIAEYVWYNRVKAAFDQLDFLTAAQIADQGLAEIPGNKSLQNAKSTALKNHAITVHNEFARLVNSRKVEEARAVIEKGLEENPTSQVLQNDLKKLNSLR